MIPDSKEVLSKFSENYKSGKENSKYPERAEVIAKEALEAMKQYGKQVRDYTLEVASKEATDESSSYSKDGLNQVQLNILNLKNDPRLEI